jgi:hypothetical protein
MSRFDECPARWRAERIEKVQEPRSKPREIGIIIAEVVRAYREELYSSGLEEYAAGMPAIVERIFGEHPRITSTEHYNDVMIACKGFAKQYRLRVNDLIGLEIQCNISLGENYPELHGYIDIAETEHDDQGEFIGITDDKAGWGATVLPAYRFQLDLYALRMRIEYPNTRIKVRNHFIRHNLVTPYRLIEPWDYENVLGHARATITRMDNAKKFDNYPPIPNENCDFCPIAARCTVFQGLQQNAGAILTDDAAKVMLGAILVLDAARAVRMKALKAWVDGTGPVKLENGAQAAYSSPKALPTVVQIKELIEALGDEAYPLLRVDSKKLRKYDDDSRLDELWVPGIPKPKFTVGRAKGDEDDD